jgi:hypothetical protein
MRALRLLYKQVSPKSYQIFDGIFHIFDAFYHNICYNRSQSTKTLDRKEERKLNYENHGRTFWHVA